MGLEVRTTRDLVDRVRSRLPPGAVACDEVDPAFRYSLHREKSEFLVSRNEKRIACHLDLEAALDEIEDRLRFDVACESTEHLFVHAGVVALDGRALVIPGSSGAGKSHLVAALVAAGALYYSDEFALIDNAGRVHPYPQKLALASASGEPKQKVSAETFGGLVGAEPLPVGLVLVTGYKPDARFEPEALTPAQAVLELLAHVVRARSAPQEALERLATASRSAIALRSDRGEAGALAPDILHLLRQTSTEN